MEFYEYDKTDDTYLGGDGEWYEGNSVRAYAQELKDAELAQQNEAVTYVDQRLAQVGEAMEQEIERSRQQAEADAYIALPENQALLQKMADEEQHARRMATAEQAAEYTRQMQQSAEWNAAVAAQRAEEDAERARQERHIALEIKANSAKDYVRAGAVPPGGAFSAAFDASVLGRDRAGDTGKLPVA